MAIQAPAYTPDAPKPRSEKHFGRNHLQGAGHFFSLISHVGDRLTSGLEPASGFAPEATTARRRQASSNRREASPDPTHAAESQEPSALLLAADNITPKNRAADQHRPWTERDCREHRAPSNSTVEINFATVAHCLDHRRQHLTTGECGVELTPAMIGNSDPPRPADACITWLGLRLRCLSAWPHAHRLDQ